MGIFKKMFSKNLTKKWVRESGLELLFDFNDFTLNGIKLFSDVNSLSFLGYSEDVGEGYIDFMDNGLTVYLVEDKIDGFAFYNNSDTEGIFTGKIKIKDRLFSIEELSSFDFVRNILGKPSEEDLEDKTCLYYEYPDYGDVLFDFQDGRLEDIDISRHV